MAMADQVIPGFEAFSQNKKVTVKIQGGLNDWMEYPSIKKFTNAFIIDETNKKILLGYKKRGFAQGIYNGFGGKIDQGETSLEAAIRELKEEADIKAPLRQCGLLFFYQAGHNYAHHIDIYCAESWSGDPSETDEMKPSWFDIPPPGTDFEVLAEQQTRDKSESDSEETKVTLIPFHRMWKDDMLWMPFLFSKQPFIGRVDLVDPASGDNAVNAAPLHPMVKWWFATLD